MQKRTKVNVIKIRTTFHYEKLRMTLSCGMMDDLLEIEDRTEQAGDGFNLNLCGDGRLGMLSILFIDRV